MSLAAPTPVTVSGRDFGALAGTVTLGGSIVPPDAWGSSTVTFSVPAMRANATAWPAGQAQEIIVVRADGRRSSGGSKLTLTA